MPANNLVVAASTSTRKLFYAMLLLLVLVILYNAETNMLRSIVEISSLMALNESPMNGGRADGNKSNKTFSTSLFKPSSPVKIPAGNLYKSQSGEDMKLLTWFEGMKNGTYIEMGGLDGVRFSNSYFFRHALDWSGVLIELNTVSYKKLVENRPNDVTIHAGVCSNPQKLHWVEARDGAVAGIFEFAAPSFKKNWWGGIVGEDGSLKNDTDRVHEIQCDTLDSLLLEHAPSMNYFDFFSLDVEGAELSVLESIDFDRVGFGIIFVEADEHNGLKNLIMRKFLEDKGYSFMFEYERSYWFWSENFYDIYKDLAY